MAKLAYDGMSDDSVYAEFIVFCTLHTHILMLLFAFVLNNMTGAGEAEC